LKEHGPSQRTPIIKVVAAKTVTTAVREVDLRVQDHPVCTENLSSGVVVVKSANDGV